mmetsp:Transcript_37760/g.121178  ORF Transcript_37760/g.121178 Transcript_37760/m.121178 type:complete len:161 (-) Transcript_37760:254-736(-)|eukprot:CAMPEP_0118891034 /NCGR_PEP_ID=MMETSP1166-20130328/1218_1 /TAXON_ID=1104430 /ORGANISM="Chrysoreinhardia sp, Strain CCMP3193" /LENGTH=160 /DNA_ID=CAMNT_0006829669 /DNA_START=134 /DNA_END=616 /DNA_ORIENTATION=+
MKKALKTMACFISFFFLFGVAMGDTFEICLKDAIGEMVHLDVYPSGLVVGYSEFDFGEGLVTAGTAFGSFRTLAYPKVMIGGDVNNDCTLGLLFPGKLNVIINVETLTGNATGVLFGCNPAAPVVIPFDGPIVPCPGDEVPAANWRLFFETDDDDDDKED